ncbi:unnamed protein product, partial [Penicillium discolor]
SAEDRGEERADEDADLHVVVRDAAAAVRELTHQQRDREADAREQGHAGEIRPAQRLVEAQGRYATQQERREQDADGLPEHQPRDDPDGDGVGQRRDQAVHAADLDPGREEREDRHGDEGRHDAPAIREVRGETVVDRGAVRVRPGPHPRAGRRTHRDQEAEQHPRDRRVHPGCMHERPHGEGEREQDPPGTDAVLHGEREAREGEEREDQPGEADGLGVEGGDDRDGDQVVDDREREQEHPQCRRQEAAHDGEHRDRERDVRGRGDRPSAEDLGAGGRVDRDEEQGGDDDAPDRGGDRKRGTARIAQPPGDELLLQLQPDDEEEHGEQAVGGPGAHAELEVPLRDPETEVPDGLVPGGGGGVGEDQGGERGGQQQTAAEHVAPGGGADAAPQLMRRETETGRGRRRRHRGTSRQLDG